MTRVAVVGAAGYAGVEAARWVLGHPGLTLTCVTSSADAGRRLGELYPALAPHTDIRFSPHDVATVADAADVALLAVPHTAAIAMVPGLLESGLRVVDMSADFRLADASIYEDWYGVAHEAADLLGEAVYGLPELDRTGLADARLVAAPGCYPTATALAAIPALEAGIVADGAVFVDAKSGVSGAGRALSDSTHFCAVDEAFTAYKVATHRHTPEIEQSLERAAGRAVPVTFVPHLVPMKRGILATVYMKLADPLDTDQALDIYGARYAAEPFVRVCEAGTTPSTAHVAGTNMASVGVVADHRTGTLVAICAIDNLGKGAAGQAVQCLNAMLGLPETDGLLVPGAVV